MVYVNTTYTIVEVSIRETDSSSHDGIQYNDILQISAKSPVISVCISTTVDMKISLTLLGSFISGNIFLEQRLTLPKPFRIV